MPELPEVETIRLGLRRRITGKRIVRVKVLKPNLVRGPVKKFASVLVGASFSNIDRRGKLLILRLKGTDSALLIHLKMTGQLIYERGRTMIAGGHGSLPRKYTYIILEFADGSHLYFNDMRQFGYMQIVSAKMLADILCRYGIDPLHADFTWPAFASAFKNRRLRLKAALLNQTIIAGIGNIYADEIAHHARLRPDRRASSLTEQELKEVYRATRHIIARALKHGGTTFKDYRNADGGKGNFTRLLKVYGRGGLKCKRCKDVLLHRMVVAGRGTVFCPKCQK